MGSSVFRLSRKRVLALALGLGIAGSLASAPASLAATQQPPVGANCQADGKINGGGSTFQTNAINNAFTYGFQNDVCGTQASSSNLFQGGTFNSLAFPSWGTTDPSVFSFSGNSVQGMVAYNVSLSGTAGSNGSGAGLKRVSCRTDMFGGTDLPYNNVQLGSGAGSTAGVGVDGAPGSESGGSAPNYNCQSQSNINTQAVPPPYGPQAYGFWPNPNGETNTTFKAMSFPIAAGAVAYVANLENTSPSSTAGGCTTTPSAGQELDLTTSEFDAIWEGTINQWNDPTLVANNSWLSTDGCSGPIQRVVREDNSGTTAITMFTLNAYNKALSGLCAGGEAGTPAAPAGVSWSNSNDNWYFAAISSSNWGWWPRGCKDASNNVAPNEVWAGETSSTTESGSSGSGALINLVETNAAPFPTGNGGWGSFGYAELGLWGTAPTTTPGLVEAALPSPVTQSSGSPTYVTPGNPGSQSTCQLPASVPTGAGGTNAVGLGATTWTNTGTPSAPGKQDIADTLSSSGYPACGLTFDLVYTHQSEANEVAAPAGSSVTATPGCTIPAGSTPAAQTTTVDNPSGSASVVVPSTAGYPASGTIDVSGGVGNLAYTSLTSTSFVLSSATTVDIPSGSTVTLGSTTLAATATTPGITGACQTYNDSLSGITNDQLRTLYSYFTYMFSPLGEDQTSSGATNTNLQNQTLDPLPVAWLPALEQGYQANF